MYEKRTKDDQGRNKKAFGKPKNAKTIEAVLEKKAKRNEIKKNRGESECFRTSKYLQS